MELTDNELMIFRQLLKSCDVKGTDNMRLIINLEDKVISEIKNRKEKADQ